MRTSICLAVLALCVMLMPTFASADIGGVPDNLVVVAGGLDWVWAAPCAPVLPSCNASGHDLTLTNGWQIATGADYASSFADLAHLYNAFNPPNGQLCASAYFDSGYSHCDSGDLAAGYAWNLPAGWGPDPSNLADETFLVQQAVPEPGSLMLFGSGLVGLAGVVRRKFNL